jgi:hypothetical protein
MTQWGLDTLFNPAKRHMDEEKRRLQSTREEIGDSSGGKRIDLESGKVTIRRTNRAADDEVDDAQEAEDAPDVADDEAVEQSGQTAEAPEQPAEQPEKRPAKPEPSPAAIRAAKRRGLKPR